MSIEKSDLRIAINIAKANIKWYKNCGYKELAEKEKYRLECMQQKYKTLK